MKRSQIESLIERRVAAVSWLTDPELSLVVRTVMAALNELDPVYVCQRTDREVWGPEDDPAVAALVDDLTDFELAALTSEGEFMTMRMVPIDAQFRAIPEPTEPDPNQGSLL